MEKTIKNEEFERFKRVLRYTLSLVVFAALLLVWDKSNTALASAVAGSTVAYDLNYQNETLVVKPGAGGSTRFYISLDKQKSWENLDPSGEVDLSMILSSKEVSVFIKGNKDTNPLEVKLMAEPNTIKAVYSIINGVGQVTCTTTGSAVEYRKGNYGIWKSAPAILYTYPYEVKGATLYFRSVALPGLRAGKIITVKIPKRPSQPSVKLDGNKLVITGIKANDTQYFNPSTGLWEYVTTNTKIKTVSLYTLAKLSATANVPLPAMSLEFRSYVPNKKAISGVKLIDVPVQPTCPDGIRLEGSTLTITDTAKRAYEYFKVQNGVAFDITTVKWTTIQPNKAVIIPKARVNDRIYVRLKSSVDKVTKVVTPASTYRNEFVVTSITVK